MSPLEDAYLRRRQDLRRLYIARSGRAEDADDLLQGLYLKIRQAAPGTDIRDPESYLFRLAYNHLTESFRRARSAAARDDRWLRETTAVLRQDAVADVASPEEAAISSDALRKALSAIESLSPQSQRVFRMHKLSGMSHVEIAETLGISRSAVEKHMIKALALLTAVVQR